MEWNPTEMLRAVQRIFTGLAGAYALGSLLFLLLRVVRSESDLPLLGLFNSFAQWIWITALILLIFALLLRDVRLTIMLLPSALLLLVTYGGQFLPRSVRVLADAHALNLLTYNIEAPNMQHDRVIEVIRAANADVVALQEVSLQIAPLLQRAFADSYPYMALHPHPGGYAGQGLLSRYPILEDRYWQTDPAWSLGHQRVRLLLPDGTQIVLYNGHPPPPYLGQPDSFNDQLRNADLLQLLALIEQENEPHLLAGDLNMTDQNALYPRLTAHLRDSFREAGYGLGWSFASFLPLPALRIDYVLHSDHWTAQSAHVLADSGGSDHYPLQVRLILTP
jgi:vancomycin resistance protein VanJ